METTHSEMPPAIASLPEPARTKAIETMNALVRDGSSREEALERAVALASQWVYERAPGDRAAVPSPDVDASPERPPVPSRS